MKIAFFEIEDWEKAFIEKNLSGNEIRYEDSHLTVENASLYRDVEIISSFIYSELDEKVLEQLPALKLIVTRSTGYDHIDLAYCEKRGIIVSNVPEYGTHTVAEHTFALILALSRNLIPSIERTKKGDFDLTGLTGFDLNGKTLGIIGLGNIGKAVVKIAHGFNMNVLVYTRHPDDILARELNITFTPLEELLMSSDIVSLHVPSSPETEHIINQNNILKFKPGSLLINTARGGLIETEAILTGLEKGILRGVGIDVLEEESQIREERQLLTAKFLKDSDLKTQLLNHVLLTRENVIITPHNAFNSTEALHAILEVTVANIKGFTQGIPENVISQKLT